jgi:hypothetical protein
MSVDKKFTIGLVTLGKDYPMSDNYSIEQILVNCPIGVSNGVIAWAVRNYLGEKFDKTPRDRMRCFTATKDKPGVVDFISMGEDHEERHYKIASVTMDRSASYVIERVGFDNHDLSTKSKEWAAKKAKKPVAGEEDVITVYHGADDAINYVGLQSVIDLFKYSLSNAWLYVALGSFIGSVLFLPYHLIGGRNPTLPMIAIIEAVIFINGFIKGLVDAMSQYCYRLIPYDHGVVVIYNAPIKRRAVRKAIAKEVQNMLSDHHVVDYRKDLSFHKNYAIVSGDTKSNRSLENALDMSDFMFTSSGLTRFKTDMLTREGHYQVLDDDSDDTQDDASQVDDVLRNLTLIADKTLSESSPIWPKIQDLQAALETAGPEDSKVLLESAVKLTAKLEDMKKNADLVSSVDSSLQDLDEVIQEYKRMQTPEQ